MTLSSGGARSALELLRRRTASQLLGRPPPRSITVADPAAQPAPGLHHVPGPAADAAGGRLPDPGIGATLSTRVAEAVLLSLQAVQAGDQAGACVRVMEAASVLSAAGVRRDLLHTAGQVGALSSGSKAGMGAAVVDEALGRLAEGSLLAFSLDGRAVIAHRLVSRIVRDSLAEQGRLAAVGLAVASVLETHARALAGSRDRAAMRDFPEQVTALWQAASGVADASSELEQISLGLRLWALYHLIELGDSAWQAIAMGEPLMMDSERVLGPDHPDTMKSRNNLAAAYYEAGRVAEAIPLLEQTLADRERVLGPDHPDTLNSRGNLASVYEAAGRLAEAIQLHERTHATFERALGPGHPDTLAS